MNKVLAEVRIDNMCTSVMSISKLSEDDSRKKRFKDEVSNTLLSPQGFVWYQDFVAFDMLGDIESYWVKIAVAETLEIDPVIAKAMNSKKGCDDSVILLPFQVDKEDRLYVFGDDDALILSFTLPAGHYQLLFQNRFFTREEIEASPNNDCQDLDYDYGGCDYIPELCQLTFIPTDKVIEPEILVYKGSLKSQKPPSTLILFDRKMYEDGNN